MLLVPSQLGGAAATARHKKAGRRHRGRRRFSDQDPTNAYGTSHIGQCPRARTERKMNTNDRTDGKGAAVDCEVGQKAACSHSTAPATFVSSPPGDAWDGGCSKSGRNARAEESARVGAKSSVNYGRGTVPNVVWLSVAEADLRCHPDYTPLPPPECVSSLQTWRDVSRFRQDSVQWDMLHRGRLTTSRAAGALGILEPKAARKLGVPRGLSGSRKAMHSQGHLAETPLFESLEGAAAHLVDQRMSDATKAERVSAWKKDLGERRGKAWRGWGRDRSWRSSAWSCCYLRWCRKQERSRKGNGILRGNHVGMLWGTVHEATAVLCALNYFHGSGAKVHECGMYPGEALFSARGSECPEQLALVHRLQDLGVPIGATPDGIICHNDGTVEVLEVKNHSPFRYSRRHERSFVQDRDPPGEVPPWYVPQVQLEMLCVGAHCRSAIFVRLTATCGATILRVRRDDRFILDMLQRLLEFVERFVIPGSMPSEDFGETGALGSRWDEFLDLTSAVSSSATLLAHIPHDSIQRKRPGTVPLLV